MKCFSQEIINIPVGKVTLEAELTLPEGAGSFLIFSHASSRSRFSRRYQKLARQLQEHGYGTLLVDLLTDEEDEAYYYTRFDIDLLTRRLTGITEWLERYQATSGLNIGYLAAGNGAAAALRAAYYLPHIRVVVCHGGRPGLAADVLERLESPVLLITGTLDNDLLEENRNAFEKLQCHKKLLEIKGASQLFVENNAMTNVTEGAIKWFDRYLKTVKHPALGN